MHQATIHIDPVGASPIGFAQAEGMPGNIRFNFKTQGNIAYPEIALLYPQLVLRPYTQHGVYAYDIEIDDPVGASGLAAVPASVMKDRFNIEVYARNSALQPQWMLAYGRIDIIGYSGHVSSASFTQGPPGPPGPPGERGSRWYTGAGAPAGVPDDRVAGDMWLDETTGDVWRWDDATAMWLGYTRK